MMRRRSFLFGLLGVGTAAAVGLAALRPRGVRVTVKNRGSEPLADVVVHVTGNSYQLGTLETGEARTVSVRPSSESHVELGFPRASGQRLRLNAGGYFQASGYARSIEL